MKKFKIYFKTMKQIAHTLITVKDCNKIFVFKDGQIVETGNHKDLLNQKGYYYQLWNGQYNIVNQE